MSEGHGVRRAGPAALGFDNRGGATSQRMQAASEVGEGKTTNSL